MSLNTNNITYNSRALSSFQNLLFKIRAWFYEREIIVSIFESMGKEKSNGKNIDLGGGMGHKTEKIYHNLIGKNGSLELVEPSEGMLQKAYENLQHDNILISKGSSRDLSEHRGVENIFCNQMTHHLTYDEKKELFYNAHGALKDEGKLFILDTTAPEGKMLSLVFQVLRKSYKKIVGKGNNYYNITTQEYIIMLEGAGFEVDLEYTKHFYILKKIGEIGTRLGILYPFMTQIVAIKK